LPDRFQVLSAVVWGARCPHVFMFVTDAKGALARPLMISWYFAYSLASVGKVSKLTRAMAGAGFVHSTSVWVICWQVDIRRSPGADLAVVLSAESSAPAGGDAGTVAWGDPVVTLPAWLASTPPIVPPAITSTSTPRVSPVRRPRRPGRRLRTGLSGLSGLSWPCEPPGPPRPLAPSAG
jgi:hypothetical protein